MDCMVIQENCKKQKNQESHAVMHFCFQLLESLQSILDDDMDQTK